MNRIYQGRVSSVQIRNPDEAARKSIPWVPLDADAKRAREIAEIALWDHHVLYQDAVNYYIVALASMGVSPQSRLTRLRELLSRVWESADKMGQRRGGMSGSLQRAWQLEKPPTLAEAVERFSRPLKLHGVSDNEMELAGESLAYDLGGEGSIQQGGPEYWPYFCQSGFRRGVTFPRSAEQLAKEDAQSQMASWIWDAKSSSDIARLHQKLTQGFFCNLVTGQGYLPSDSCRLLFGEALNFLSSNKLISNEQKRLWLDALEQNVPEVAAYAGGSINKTALKTRFYSFLVFKHLSPDEAGLDVLRRVYQKPEDNETKKVVRINPKYQTEIQLRSLGDDPIKLVRNKAQIVFRAFTALPIWRSSTVGEELYEISTFRHEIERRESHRIAWKDFDIAAFKEALKVYNQFQQNIDKREEKLDALASKLLAMDGERAIEAYAEQTDKDQMLRARLARIWAETAGKPKNPTSESGEDIESVRFAGDRRIDRLRQIVNDDLAEEYRLTDGRATPYGLRRRTMKGWNDVKRRWRQLLVRIGATFSKEKCAELKTELDILRGGEKREQIGSHKLFEALLKDDEAWQIWREPDEILVEQISKNSWAVDPLESFREYCETREAFEEISGRPLNFTPADARYSRRLFIFSDACSFGKDRGEYRHDSKESAVIVPVAWKDETGKFVIQPRRLAYSAPRLLRDNIRAEDGTYVQDWTQPMMRALFGDSIERPNPQELKEAAVQLMPDFDGDDRLRILLNFPLSLNEASLRARLSKAELWHKQFHSWKKGTQLPFLRWPSEFDPKEHHCWWEQTKLFRVLAADLGTRNAASVALIEASCEKGPTSRFIGEAGGQNWYARYRTGSVLRLPGENAQVLRPKGRLDRDEGDKVFREELYGARGRRSSGNECAETITILSDLKQLGLLGDAIEPHDLQRRFSFPELNDKLLIALRRTQNWIATCISWHWKLDQPDNEEQRASALSQIAEHDRMIEWKLLADGNEAKSLQLRDALRDHIVQQRETVRLHLLDATRRILPLRSRTWEWVRHPDKSDCHILRQTALGRATDKVLLSGQRGLSIARIEQLTELRRRWQSLNQSLRRELGQKPLTASEMRNDPIPDPCPDILRKLENIREQRVNQTAHLVLAQALGLKLRQPITSPEKRRALDMHGEYQVARPPVDMIVLEDLSRYLSDQGRTKSENTRLMKWCHRAITQKIKMLAEPFGISVLETPAAYSSRFCSLTGIAGFRAVEVRWEDRYLFRWRVLLEEAAKSRAEGKNPSPDAKNAEALFGQLKLISESPQPRRTLLAPQPGGPIFVTAKALAHPAPAESRKNPHHGQVLPMQADINAATNLALRAIAHPACADLHHRLRTLRKPGTKSQPDTHVTRELRRFLKEGKNGVPIILSCGHTLPKERNSNLFFDPYGVATFGKARLACDSDDRFPYASGPGLWLVVNDRSFQWQRCSEVNQQRLARETHDDVPM